MGETDGDSDGIGPQVERTLSGEELAMALAAYLKTTHGSIGDLEIVWEVTAAAADGTPGDIIARCTFTKLS